MEPQTIKPKHCVESLQVIDYDQMDTDLDLHFRPVSPSDIPILSHFFHAYPSRSCDFTIGGVLIWADMFDYKIAEYEGSLLIKGRMPGSDRELFYSPIGPMASELFLNLVWEYCRKRGLQGSVLLPEEHAPSEEGDGMPHFPELMEGMTEYLYDIERFKTFGGRKMEKKRNHLNFFNHHYDAVTAELVTGRDAAELISFTLAFGLAHQDDTADYECRNLIEQMRDYDRYPYFGMLLRDRGQLIGYTFGEAIGDTFVIHAEKGNIDYRGVYQALASRLANAVAQRYPEIRYLNREDDMGYEHLRQSKLSYHPTLYIAKRMIQIG